MIFQSPFLLSREALNSVGVALAELPPLWLSSHAAWRIQRGGFRSSRTTFRVRLSLLSRSKNRFGQSFEANVQKRSKKIKKRDDKIFWKFISLLGPQLFAETSPSFTNPTKRDVARWRIWQYPFYPSEKRPKGTYFLVISLVLNIGVLKIGQM